MNKNIISILETYHKQVYHAQLKEDDIGGGNIQFTVTGVAGNDWILGYAFVGKDDYAAARSMYSNIQDPSNRTVATVRSAESIDNVRRLIPSESSKVQDNEELSQDDLIHFRGTNKKLRIQVNSVAQNETVTLYIELYTKVPVTITFVSTSGNQTVTEYYNSIEL